MVLPEEGLMTQKQAQAGVFHSICNDLKRRYSIILLFTAFLLCSSILEQDHSAFTNIKGW